ncbi:hypothetical protein TKK_0006614 [Trichogramma kaykai]
MSSPLILDDSRSIRPISERCGSKFDSIILATGEAKSVEKRESKLNDEETVETPQLFPNVSNSDVHREISGSEMQENDKNHEMKLNDIVMAIKTSEPISNVSFLEHQEKVASCETQKLERNCEIELTE